MFILRYTYIFIISEGKLSGGVNRIGIEYYNNLTNELLANGGYYSSQYYYHMISLIKFSLYYIHILNFLGIEPYITLFHWDTPQALEDEYGGFRGREIV